MNDRRRASSDSLHPRRRSSDTASIRRTLARAILVTTAIALATLSAASIGLEVMRYRESAETSLRALGDVVALYCLPVLGLGDVDAGDEALSVLSKEATISSAVIFDAAGRPFASYQRPGSSEALPTRRGDPGLHYGTNALEYRTAIEKSGATVGYLFLRKELSELRSAIWQAAATIAGVMLVALLLSSVVASRIREHIAQPLDELARSAGAMERGDLTQEVRVHREDELGRLAEGFDRTREGLRSLVSQVRQETVAINDDTQILLEVSQGLSGQAARQREVVENAGSSLERVGASARDVRDTVDGLATGATEASSAVTELGATARRIDEHMDHLFETVDGSASSISQMSAAIRQIAQHTDVVGATTRSTNSSIQVLRETVKTVEGNARECDALAAKTRDHAERGGDVVGQAVRGMERIHANFQGLERTISDLAGRSEVIDEVLKVIEAVVAETNLLALNASIISSHAGEHGRAFAVVAQEVKNLADRTAGSTREIAEAMEDVRGGIQEAVRSVGEGAQSVHRGVSLSEEAGQALEEIRESAEQSSSKVAEIVRAAERQSLDIDVVDSAMAELHGGVEQITVGTHEQDKVAIELLEGIEQLRQLAREVKAATSEQSRQSGHMAQSVEGLATGVTQILSSAEIQHSEVGSILDALELFREQTSESTRLADSLRECVDSLGSRAEQLNEGVGRFTI